MQITETKRNSIIAVLATTVMLMFFALYNNYPILNDDSNSYLNSGFTLTIPGDRPIFYGLFLRIFSLGISLWIAVFFQALLLSYLMVKVIRQLLPGIPLLHLLGLSLLVSMGTIAGWYVAQIMPDIFTPMVFLATFLLLTGTHTTSTRILIGAILFLAVLTHLSHFVTFTLFAVVVFCGGLFVKKLKQFRVRSLYLFGLSLVCWLSVMLSNVWGGNGFTTGKGSHVFLMGKLAESGILKTYLDKACPIYNYNICPYKDSMPPVAWDFVWDGKSPVYRTGGWEANRAEYKTIIGDIISRPKYWPFLAWKSMEGTARQMVLMNIDEGVERPWIKYEADHPVFQMIKQYFPHEINEFEVSKQNYTMLNWKFYDDVWVIVLILSSLLVAFCLPQKYYAQAGLVYFLLFLFILLNAFSTATFANVSTRLNSRAMFLIPFLNFGYIYLSRQNKRNLL